MDETYSLILLSAGKSERMGLSKADLTLGKHTFLEKIISTYTDVEITKQVYVVNETMPKVKNSVVNHHYEKGRIYSLQLGLQKTESNWYFLQNIDNPFITVELIQTFIDCKKDADMIQPIFNGKKGHPILISEKVKQEVLKERNYNLTLRDVFSRFDKQQMKVNNNSILININTPEDYKKYCIEKVN